MQPRAASFITHDAAVAYEARRVLVQLFNSLMPHSRVTDRNLDLHWPRLDGVGSLT
jgi:hypothetical protein